VPICIADERGYVEMRTGARLGAAPRHLGSVTAHGDSPNLPECHPHPFAAHHQHMTPGAVALHNMSTVPKKNSRDVKPALWRPSRA